MNKALILSLFMSISNIAIADFVKLSNEGEVLDFENSNWSCVLDQKTSLVWEVKVETEGLQYTMNTYTWFDGETGRGNGMYSKNCFWGESCNTQSYIDDINEGLSIATLTPITIFTIHIILPTTITIKPSVSVHGILQSLFFTFHFPYERGLLVQDARPIRIFKIQNFAFVG